MNRKPIGYDEVRRRLLDRGYLDGRVERFVLGGTAGGLRPWRTASRAALVGGPLLGALLSGTAVFAAGLAFRDFLLLTLYFSIPAALSLIALDAIAGGVATALARRGLGGDRAAMRGALIVALPTFCYLLLLWWRRLPEAGIVDDFLFLAFALCTVGLLAWLADLVSVARIAAVLGEVPRRRRRPALVVVAPLVAAALLFGISRARLERPSGEPPTFVVDDAATPLVLVGIDGLDHDLVSALEPAGAVAGLLDLMERSVVFPLVHAEGAPPPAIWTSIATGVEPAVHRVGSPSQEQLPGVGAPLDQAGPLPLAGALRLLLPTRTVPSSAAGREVRTLWEVVALKGSSASVGWWGSWPPESAPELGSAFVVTDRALPKLLAGAEADRDTEPAALYLRLAASLPEDLATIAVEFGEFPGAEAPGSLAEVLAESHGIDAWNLGIADRLAEATEARAVFVYLPGLDILRERLRRAESAPGGTVARMGAADAIEAYVRWLDGQIQGLSARFPGRQQWLVADPGRSAAVGAEGFAVHHRSGRLAPCLGGSLQAVQVAPLVLESLGFPVSREMGPRPAGDPCLGEQPDRPAVAEFGRRGRQQAVRSAEGEQAVLERLRSLGYVD